MGCIWLHLAAVAQAMRLKRLYLCPSTFSDAHNPVLVGMEDLAHFTHWLGVRGGGGEVAIQVQAPKEAPPAIVPLSSVG